MEEIHYQGLNKKLKISIEHLYSDDEDLLRQIEEGIRTRPINCPVVGYQGMPGAFGEDAMISYFKEEWQTCKRYDAFEDVIEALRNDEIDYGVLPIENSSAGEILDTYDLINANEFYIVGEQVVRVEHNLLGLPEAKLEDIQDVYAHGQAISQSKMFLKEHPYMEAHPYINNATACQFVAQSRDKTKAAIASKRAAKLYGLEVLAPNIHFNKNNCTRFVILGKKMEIEETSDKISIIFTTAHRSGSLYNILGHFAYNGLNLLKIQSRPLLKKEWEYYFFVDIEGNLEQADVLIALSRVREESKYFKILGNYKRFS